MTQERTVENLEEEMQEQEPALANESANGVEPPEQDAGEPAEASEAQLVEQLKAELALAQGKADELTDKLQRSAAEFQNSRRRQERQLAEEIERSSSHLLRRLLPVLDDFQLAFSNLPAELSEGQIAWVEGFRQIQKKLNGLLEEEGVTVVAQDGNFDPTRHEAIATVPDESLPAGHIVDTLRAGYEYKGRVLRPALVRLAG